MISAVSTSSATSASAATTDTPSASNESVLQGQLSGLQRQLTSAKGCKSKESQQLAQEIQAQIAAVQQAIAAAQAKSQVKKAAAQKAVDPNLGNHVNIYA